MKRERKGGVERQTDRHGQRDREAEKQRMPGVKVSDPGCALEELPEIAAVFLAFIFPLAHRRR